MQERWQFKNPRGQSTEPPAARILKQRGFTPTEIENFLNPTPENLGDPQIFPGISSAVSRITRAQKEQERVLLYGDYDVGGITSTALLFNYLTEILGLKCHYYLPDRIRDGYGLNLEALRSLGLDNFDLIITVDCGITAFKEVEFLQDEGIDVIVTDHHEPADELPPALSLINHHLLEEEDKIRGGLSGVGTAFKLCQALEQQIDSSADANSTPGLLTPYLRSLLDLVALGTVADLVPLQGENRILVREGLKVLKKTENAGLQALAASLSLDLSREISAGQIGYILAPPLNAAGRIKSADQALQLLLAENRWQVEGLAEKLVEYNYQRHQEEDRTLKEAQEMIAADPPDEREGIVLASRGWHPGVIGIVASRLVEEYYRPVILIALDDKNQITEAKESPQNGDRQQNHEKRQDQKNQNNQGNMDINKKINKKMENQKESENYSRTVIRERGRGSGRSISALNLHQALKACSSHLLGFGGHSQAAGMEIAAEKVADFRRAFNSYLRENLTSRDFIPIRQIDDILSEQQVSLDFYQELKSLKPHGIGNPAPAFLFPRVSLQQTRAVGRENRHLQLKTSGGLRGIGFNLAADFDFSGTDSSYNIIARVEDNNWRGRQTVQLNLKSLVPVNRQQDFPIIYSDRNLKLYDCRNSSAPENLLSSLPGGLNSSLIYLNSRKLKTRLAEKFPEAICCTSSQRAAASKRRQVFFLELPFSLKEILEVAGNSHNKIKEGEKSSWTQQEESSSRELEIYFLFGEEDLARNQRILQRRLVSKSPLEQAWQIISRQEKFSRRELPGLLKDCPDFQPAAADQLLEIWQELELITRDQKDYRINSSLSGELDLSHSIRYNRNVEIKEDFARLRELLFSDDLREVFQLLQEELNFEYPEPFDSL